MVATLLFAFHDSGTNVVDTDGNGGGKQREFKWLVLKRTSLAVDDREPVKSPAGTTRLVDGKEYTWAASSVDCTARLPARTGPHGHTAPLSRLSRVSLAHPCTPVSLNHPRALPGRPARARIPQTALYRWGVDGAGDRPGSSISLRDRSRCHLANRGNKTLYKAACDAGSATFEAWGAAFVFADLFAALCPEQTEYAYCELFKLATEQVLLDQSDLMPNVSPDAYGQ